MSEAFDLHRFVEAQNDGGTYGQAVRELRHGQKRSHWMWFIFPQIKGLGSSPISQRFAITSLEEAKAYLLHPVLGPRLQECTAAVLAVNDRSLQDVFGGIDAMKFCSSMTLFAQAAGGGSVFEQALGRWCGGRPDEATLQRLGTGRSSPSRR